jgi:hypothetical protein
MKILYICPNFSNKTYSYYGMIPYGLKKLNYDVTCITGLSNFNILDNYDVIIFGYRGFNKNLYNNKFRNNLKIYNLLGAQSCQEFKEKGNTLNRNKNIINLTSMVSLNFLRKKYFNNLIHFPYSFYPELFKDYGLEKIYDIGMSGALHSSDKYPDDSFCEEEKDIRERAKNILISLKSKYKIFIQSSDIFQESRINTDIEYAKTINSSKIWLAFNSAYSDIPSRHFQIPASKTLLFCNEQKHEEFTKIFKNGINCVYIKNDLSDLEEKINFYSTNKNKYEEIVENGYQEFHKKHTNVERAKQLIEIIKK